MNELVCMLYHEFTYSWTLTQPPYQGGHPNVRTERRLAARLAVSLLL